MRYELVHRRIQSETQGMIEVRESKVFRLKAALIQHLQHKHLRIYKLEITEVEPEAVLLKGISQETLGRVMKL